MCVGDTHVDYCLSNHLTDTYTYAKQKYPGCKKGEANQKQQLSDDE